MWEYMRAHEAAVRAALADEKGGVSLDELHVFHDRQIRFMQHERLVHLIVLLFFALFLLLSVAFLAAHPGWPGLAMTLLLLPLVAAYMLHYYRMENAIQRWYRLANEIDVRRGAASARLVERLR